MPQSANPPGGRNPPEAAFQVLDGESRTCYWPSLLRALYKRAQTREVPPPLIHPLDPDPLTRLARVGADRPALMVVGSAPARPRPSIPDYDALAAQVVQEGLRARAMGLDLVRACYPEPAPAQVDGPVISIGGPGSHRLSEAINQALARRACGVRGFYFAPAGEVPDRLGTLVRCWRLRAHDLPEEAEVRGPEPCHSAHAGPARV